MVPHYVGDGPVWFPTQKRGCRTLVVIQHQRGESLRDCGTPSLPGETIGAVIDVVRHPLPKESIKIAVGFIATYIETYEGGSSLKKRGISI